MHTAVTSERLVADSVRSIRTKRSKSTLTRWWKELLGVETVGIRDNFFDLGGQSLTGVRLLAKVKKKYGVDLKLATLFSAPTIEKLCCAGSQPKATPPAVSFPDSDSAEWYQTDPCFLFMRSREACSSFVIS